jgi:hypothetical protein
MANITFFVHEDRSGQIIKWFMNASNWRIATLKGIDIFTNAVVKMIRVCNYKVSFIKDQKTHLENV